MNREYDKGFADSLAQGGGVIPDLPVYSGSPSPVFGKIEGGIGFGEDVFRQREEIR